MTLRCGSVIAALAALALAEMEVTALLAQTPVGGLPIDTIDFAGTTPATPLTAKQVEVRIRRQADGSSATEESSRILYRDSAGRVRSEQSGGELVVIRDPDAK